MKRQSLLTFIILGLIIVAVGYYTFSIVREKRSVNQDTKSILSNEEDKVVYTDVAGNEVSLENNIGKIVVITLWASWSPFSTEELPRLNELAQSYDKNQVVFVALNRKEPRHQAERLLNTLPKLDHMQVVIDQEDKYYAGLGGYAMPETIIYDQKGEVKLHVRGVSKNDELKSTIESLF